MSISAHIEILTEVDQKIDKKVIQMDILESLLLDTSSWSQCLSCYGTARLPKHEKDCHLRITFSLNSALHWDHSIDINYPQESFLNYGGTETTQSTHPHLPTHSINSCITSWFKVIYADSCPRLSSSEKESLIKLKLNCTLSLQITIEDETKKKLPFCLLD